MTNLNKTAELPGVASNERLYPMIIELSSELGNVLNENKNPFLQAQIDIAIHRIKIDIGIELSRVGMFAPNDSDIDKIYYGIPEKTRCILIANYCK